MPKSLYRIMTDDDDDLEMVYVGFSGDDCPSDAIPEVVFLKVGPLSPLADLAFLLGVAINDKECPFCGELWKKRGHTCDLKESYTRTQHILYRLEIEPSRKSKGYAHA